MPRNCLNKARALCLGASPPGPGNSYPLPSSQRYWRLLQLNLFLQAGLYCNLCQVSKLLMLVFGFSLFSFATYNDAISCRVRNNIVCCLPFFKLLKVEYSQYLWFRNFIHFSQLHISLSKNKGIIFTKNLALELQIYATCMLRKTKDGLSIDDLKS